MRIARPRACGTILCGEAEKNINTHALRIISAESDNITDHKLNSCMSGEFRKEKQSFRN